MGRRDTSHPGRQGMQERPLHQWPPYVSVFYFQEE